MQPDDKFASVEAALWWAARITQEQIVQDPSTYSLAGKSRAPGTSGLNEYERHGAAAQVVAAVDVLCGIDLAYVAAKFFKQLDGVPALTEHVLPHLGTGAFRRRGVDTLVRNQFLPKWSPFMRRIRREDRQHRVPLERIRADLQIDKRMLLHYQWIVRDRLAAIHAVAIGRLEEEMIRRGLVAE